VTPADLYFAALRQGLRLEPDGDMLAVYPKGKISPAFAAVLREHKAELLDWLEAHRAALAADCVPWLHTARQILAGEFEGANRSTVEALRLGLHRIRHPLALRALKCLGLRQNEGKP
jgi:hypothetical protein